MDPSTQNDDTWLDDLEAGGAAVLNVTSFGLFSDVTGTPNTVSPTLLLPSSSTAVNNVVDNVGQQISNLLPSGGEVAAYGVGVIIALGLVFLILGKVDSL